MKLSKVMMAAIGVTAVFFVVAFVVGGALAPDLLSSWSMHHLGIDLIAANTPLVALRSRRQELETRATELLGQLTDDLPEEDARQIEAEHQGVLADLEDVRSQISEREREERNTGRRSDTVEAVRAERRRIADIRTAVRDFGFEDSDADGFIDAGTDINEVRADLQRRLAERNRDAAPRARGHRVEPGGQDERETRIALMSNAFEHRLDPSVELQEGARQYRGMRLIDMARDCLEQEGVHVRGLSADEVAKLALGMGDSQLARRAGLHSTSDFPIVLSNQINISLRRAYEHAPLTYRRIARRTTASDFRPILRAQIGDNPRLLKVNEDGEYQRGTIGEGKEQYQLDTFGRIIGVTRQVLINDQLDVFTRVPRAWGVAAAALENEIVWSIVTGNAAMADGKNLFSSEHGNLAGTGGAIGVDTVGAARHAMRQQRSVDPGGKRGEKGYRLSINANLIAVPSALETVVLQFLSNETVPASASDANPFRRSLEPLVEPLLDDDSTKAWYLFSTPDQGMIDTIEYAYLDGQEGVYTDTRMGFDVDGVEWKARLDFGAGAIDWRAMYKNPGPGGS